MSDNLAYTVWSGSFMLFGVEIKCHTLSDGKRVIEEDSMVALFDAMGKPDAMMDNDEIKKFTGWKAGA